jgi:hypothetical protein
MSRNLRTSPAFTFKNLTAIAPQEYYIFDFETDSRQTKKWIPFNEVLVLNYSSDNPIKVFINNIEVGLVPEGNSNTLRGTNTTQIKIQNIGITTIAVNYIVAVVQRTNYILKNPFKKVI